MHCAEDPHRVTRSIEKIGITERNVGRPRIDLTPDVLQNHFSRDEEEPAVIHRHDRAMQAMVQAASAGFDGADESLSSVLIQAGILV